jgi:hypothetical protein
LCRIHNFSSRVSVLDNLADCGIFVDVLFTDTSFMAKKPSPRNDGFSPQTYVLNHFEGMLGLSLPMLEVFQRITDAASTLLFCEHSF